MRRSTWWVAIAIVLSLSPTVWARGPKRQEEQVEPKAFGWLDFGGNLYARGLFDSVKRTVGTTNTNEKQSLLREGVQINTRAFVYHPNLLDMRLFADIGASQESETYTGQTNKTKGTLTSYDLSGIILREKFLSGNFDVSQAEDLEDRDFGQSLHSTRKAYAAGLSTKGKFPASLQVQRSTTHQENDTRVSDVQTDLTTFTISDRRNTDWLTDLTFVNENTQETDTYSYPGSATFTDNLPVKRNELNIDNNYRFGPGQDKNTLNGRIRWLDRKGSYPDKVFTIDQTLNLHHSKTFSTFYNGNIFNEQTLGDNEKNYSFGAGLTKQFYESLTVGLAGNYRNTKYTDGYDKYSRVGVNVDYSKKTPIGVFTSTLTASRENEAQAYSGGVFNVRNEAVTLTDITPVQLTRANITPGSIVVTDANDIVKYFEGTDYVLTTNGAYTKIARLLPSTSITNGQTVHVSYSVAVPKNSTVRTDRVDWLSRLAIKQIPFDVYFRYRTRKDTLTGGQDPNNLENEKDTIYGIEFHKAGWQVIAEHEQDDRVLSPPSRINRLQASYDHSLSRTLNLHAGAHYTKTQYLNAEQYGLKPGRDALDDIGANAQLTARLNRFILVKFLTEYSKYQGYENRSLFRNGVSLEWTQGKLTFTLDAFHDTFTQEQSNGQDTTVSFKLKREF